MFRPRGPDRKKKRPFEDNEGWRIPRIPSEQQQHPRRAVTIPILLLLAALLVTALAVLPLIPLIRSATPQTPFLSLLTPIHIFLVVMAVVFDIPLIWIFITAVQSLRGKGHPITVEATCPDHDIQPVVNFTDQGEVHGWTYRLFCRFELDGEIHEATPEGRAGKGFLIFESPEATERYLDAQITADGDCLLRIDPTDPQHASLVERTDTTADS